MHVRYHETFLMLRNTISALFKEVFIDPVLSSTFELYICCFDFTEVFEL